MSTLPLPVDLSYLQGSLRQEHSLDPAFWEKNAGKLLFVTSNSPGFFIPTSVMLAGPKPKHGLSLLLSYHLLRNPRSYKILKDSLNTSFYVKTSPPSSDPIRACIILGQENRTKCWVFS